MVSKSKETVKQSADAGGMVYCLGLIGALVYYFQEAEGFWMFVTAFFKALVWPAIFVYRFLESVA